jgi:predicted signal transduction protein with EAL and GGDEF domain
VQISTSIGIAVAAADHADPGDLLRRSDGAMYHAKVTRQGRQGDGPGSLEPAGNGSEK